MENHLQNHAKGQICPVLTVGWPMLSGFVVEGWKSDFCDDSRVKIWLFSKKKLHMAYATDGMTVLILSNEFWI